MRALSALLIATLLSACGGGSDYRPGEKDENGRVTIGKPDCSKGACK